MKSVEQSWYANDAAAGEKFEKIQKFLDLIQEHGLKIDYHPELSKIILVISFSNIARAKKIFKNIPKLTIVTGYRYLGGFIESVIAQKQWIAESVKKWTDTVRLLSLVAEHYP